MSDDTFPPKAVHTSIIRTDATDMELGVQVIKSGTIYFSANESGWHMLSADEALMLAEDLTNAVRAAVAVQS